MSPEELRAYKRDKSRLFNAHLKALRLKDKENKKRIADQQDGNQDGNLSLQDLLDIFSTLDTKMDIIQNKLETIIETKLETKLETNTLLPQFKPIFFA